MATIYDQHGRPIKRAQLTQRQAEPGLTGIRQIWAGTVAAGLTPQRLAQILLSCDEGNLDDFLILAEEMEERDLHYASVLGTRKRKISGITSVVEPGGEDRQSRKIADFVREHVAEHDGFASLVEDMLDALGKGFSVIEIDWRTSAREWVPGGFIHRDPRFFQFDRITGREIRLRDEADLVDGVPLEPGHYITHRAKIKSGLTYRGGLARVAAFTWMCKAYSVKDWMAFVETYGLPLRLGRYDQQATPEDVDVLFRAVANIGTDAAAVLPKSMEIEFQDTTRGGQSDAVFENLARWADEQISKGVLGQTMTSDDGSSMAQAEVHDEVRHDIAMADARAISSDLNRDLVKVLVDVNFGVPDRYPRLVLQVAEPENTDMLLQNTERLVNLGLKVKASEVRARLGYSEPDDDDEVIGGPVQPSQDEARNQPLDTPTDDLDEIEAEMLADWEEVATELLDPIERAIMEATTYEDALASLAEILPDMSVSALVDTLVKGMFKARSTGDVKDG